MRDGRTVVMYFGAVLNKFHTKGDETITHVISPLCKIQIALFGRLEEELNELNRLDIIRPVNDPTKWVNPLTTEEKPNSKH